MESLNKKTTPISFAAIAGKTPAPAPAPAPAVAAAAAPATTSSAEPAAKNGASNATSTASGSPSPSPSPAPASTGAGAGATAAAGGEKASTAASTSTQASASASGTASNNSGAIDWILGLNVKVVTQADEVFEGQVYAYDVLMNCLCLSKTASTSASSTPAAYYSPSMGSNNSSNTNLSNNTTSTNNTPRLKYDFQILKINHLKEVTPLPSTTNSNNGTEGTKQEDKNGISTSPTTTNQNSSHPSTINGDVYSTAVPAVGYVHLDKIQQREQQAVREAHVAAARIGVGVTSVGQEIFDALSKTLPCRWAKDSIVVMDEVMIAPPYEPENCKANASSSYTLARVKKVLEGERMRLANGRK